MQPKKCVLLVALQVKLMCATVFHANIHTCHAAKAKHVRLLEVQFCVNKNGQKEQINRSDGAEITIIQGINIIIKNKYTNFVKTAAATHFQCNCSQFSRRMEAQTCSFL